jgi:alpha-L-fucosidase
MKSDYIKNFEKMGLGLFVHFGLYSILQKGEWYYSVLTTKEDQQKYFDLSKKFKVSKNFAKDVVKTAKTMGAKYICLTTRHHEGFSLFDTKGLSDFDIMHSPTGRDVVKEFADECHKNGIVPFFYHTLLDWHHPDFNNNFPKYIDYLVDSVELLCKNYGKVGGFWFDGFWSKPNEDWQFDRLYGTIRKYQPEAMIINNTGLDERGKVGHYEIDSVTFERGKPVKVNSEDGKERAGEVCNSLTDHWGNAPLDVHYMSVPDLIDLMVECRYNGCNLIINGGIEKNGLVKGMDKGILSTFGIWMHKHEHIMRNCVTSDITADNALIFTDGTYHYAVIKNVPLIATLNVVEAKNLPFITIHTDKKITQACCYDDKKTKIKVDNKTKSFQMPAFPYGVSLYTRIIRFKLK